MDVVAQINEETPATSSSESYSHSAPEVDSALDVLQRKLEFLLVKKAKSASPLTLFELKEEIRDVRAQIAAINAEPIETPDENPNQIASDLARSLASREPSVYTYFGTIIHDRLQEFPNLRAESDYDFEKFSKAIDYSSQRLDDAINLFNLGKDAIAKEELVEGLGVLVVGLAQCCHKSTVLSKVLTSVCDAVLGIEDIPCRLDDGCERELYSLAVFAQSPRDEGIEAVLNRWIKP